MTFIESHFLQLQEKIAHSCAITGKDLREVVLLAVSKGHSAAAIRELYGLGHTLFAENYQQELQEKQALLADVPITWYFIGNIQAHKTRFLAEYVDWVLSVDRLKIAYRLQQQRPEYLPRLNITLQVNLSGEANKSGCNPDELPQLIKAIDQHCPRLRVRGLMAIPAVTSDSTQQRLAFRQLVHCQQALLQQGYALDVISMGMSSDFEAALIEGAVLKNTMMIVRIGSAIFGQRKLLI